VHLIISSVTLFGFYALYIFLTKDLTSIFYFKVEKQQIQNMYMFLHAACVKTKSVLAKSKTPSLPMTF
jgi:hypothetical protein